MISEVSVDLSIRQLCLSGSPMSERSGQCVRSCSVAVAGRSCSQSLASAHTAVRLQSDRKTRPFGILESSCGRCGLVESPQPPERNTKTLPTLYPYPIFSSLRRSPRVRRTSTGAKSRAVGSAGINAGCPQGGRVENYLELRAAEGAAIR